MIEHVLDELEQRLRTAGVPAVERLAPGLPPEVVRQELMSFAGHAPQEVVDWFSWHNGLTSYWGGRAGDGMLLASWQPRPLEPQRISKYSEGYENIWPPSWHPVFSADHFWLTVDCAVEGDRAPVFALNFPHGDLPRSKQAAESLEEFVCAWIAILDAGLVWDTGRGWWAETIAGAVSPQVWRKAGAG